MPIPDDSNDERPTPAPLWSGTDWTKPANVNPVEDLRVGSAYIFLERPLTPFERLIVANGLADLETLQGWRENPLP